jgi:ABC-type multidrug transport system fused ATPase/permease subunit
MPLRLSRRFGPWIAHHAFEFKWFYFGAFSCLYVLQRLQVEIPEKIRQLTIFMSEGRLHESSIWIFVALALGIFVFRTLSRLLFFYPARVQQKLLRMELLSLLETVPPQRFTHRAQGQIFQILFDDINNIRAFIGFGLLQVGNLFIAGFVLIPRLNESDPYLWPAFIPLFASVFFFSFTTLINQRLFKRMMEKKGEVQQYIIESYEAKQTIKNFHREDNFIKGFEKISGEELKLFFKSSVAFAFTTPYVKLGLGLSLLWGGLLIQSRGGSPSDLVFFSGFLYLFLEPVMFLSWVAVVMSQGIAAWKRIKELYLDLTCPSAVEEEAKMMKVFATAEAYELNVSYWDLQLPLKLAKGRWSVFVGETGAGKSVILSKIATLLILNGRRISMVQQEPYLFNDTIEQNIFLGEAPDEQSRIKAIELLKMFQLDNLGLNAEEVLSLEVGENGKRLSGGQMKRVALIRSLMAEAEVCIWDDPFSSVDVILERKIINALRANQHWQHKTFIVSSHRITTVRLSDEIIFLDKLKGITAQGQVDSILKEVHVSQFFKEQLMEVPLA